MPIDGKNGEGNSHQEAGGATAEVGLAPCPAPSNCRHRPRYRSASTNKENAGEGWWRLG
jgi:hypothetical protein